MSEVAARRFRGKTPRRGSLRCRRCIAAVPSLVAARETTPIVFEAPLFHHTWRLREPALRRRPDLPIDYHHVTPPVEAVVPADPVEASTKSDRSPHEEARPRPREHDERVVYRHVHIAADRLDSDVA